MLPGGSILNVAPAQKGLSSEFFTLPDIFCVNETEAEIVTGIKVTDIQVRICVGQRRWGLEKRENEVETRSR